MGDWHDCHEAVISRPAGGRCGTAISELAGFFRTRGRFQAILHCSQLTGELLPAGLRAGLILRRFRSSWDGGNRSLPACPVKGSVMGGVRENVWVKEGTER